MGMKQANGGVIVDTGFTPAPVGVADRIRACEAEIERSLQRHGCRLGVSLIRMDGKVIHQEIVVVDAKD
jgi:hypothetical protein